MLQESDRTLVEKYINDLLSSEEEALLKERVQAEPAVKNLLEEQLKMVQILRSADEDALRNQIRNTIEMSSAKSGHITRYWTYYAAASVTLLVIALGVFFLLPNTKLSLQQVAISAFEPYPAGGTSRGNTTIDKGIQLYEKQQYVEANIQLSQFADHDDPDNLYNLIVGSAYFQQRQWLAAVIYFEIGTKSTDAIIRNEALWFEALTLLATEDERYLPKIQNIADQPGPHQQEASELLQYLKDHYYEGPG